MNEEKETQEIQEETKSQSEETSASTLFEKTERIVTLQKAENDRREQLIKREEELFARKQLGGYSEAGQEQPEKKKETDEELTARFEAGELDLTKC